MVVQILDVDLFVVQILLLFVVQILLLFVVQILLLFVVQIIVQILDVLIVQIRVVLLAKLLDLDDTWLRYDHRRRRRTVDAADHGLEHVCFLHQRIHNFQQDLVFLLQSRQTVLEVIDQ